MLQQPLKIRPLAADDLPDIKVGMQLHRSRSQGCNCSPIRRASAMGQHDFSVQLPSCAHMPTCHALYILPPPQRLHRFAKAGGLPVFPGFVAAAEQVLAAAAQQRDG